MRIFLTIFILVGLSKFSTAQHGLELGGDFGIAYYFGDLNTNYDLTKPGFSIALKARQNFNERLAISGIARFSQVKGDDANSNNFFERTRNLDFKSNVFDLSATVEFNFFPYVHGSKDKFYTPYIFTGFSFMTYNPKTELNNETYSLREFGTEGQFFGNEYGSYSGSWVYGFGFKWDINKDWSVNTQITGHRIFSDYLDDVSGNYPDFATLEALRGPTAVALSNRSENTDFVQPGMQRGNGKNNDVVYILSIGIMKYFGQLQCPSISNPVY